MKKTKNKINWAEIKWLNSNQSTELGDIGRNPNETVAEGSVLQVIYQFFFKHL